MNIQKFYFSLFKYQKKYPLLLSLAIVSNLLLSVGEGILPLIVKLLFDFLSGVRYFQHDWIIFSFLIANCIVLIVASISQRKVASILGSNVIEDLRFRIVKKIQSVKPGEGGTIEEGQVLTNFTSSMMILDNVIILNIWKYLAILVIILVSAASLVYFNWHLSLIVFVFMAGMYKFPNYFSNKAGIYLNEKNNLNGNWLKLLMKR